MNERIRTLQQRLHHWKIDTLLIENPVDLLYLTHVKMSRGRLWIDSHQAELWADGRYFDEACQKSPCPVSLWERNQKIPYKGRIGFDRAWTTIAHLEQIKKEASGASWVEIEAPLTRQRLLKDSNEIESLREAARITWAGIQHIRTLFREDVSEEELAFEFEFFVRKQGAQRLAFETIVAFGENSACPHHRSSATCLKKNQIVLIDAGAVFNDYCADVTRVFPFGQIDPQLEKMQKIVQEAYQAALAEVRAGVTVAASDRAARDCLASAGVESLFTHSLGHGLGLEAHESPLIRWDGEDREMILENQMVVAIEPGLYQPGIGGVRYENSGVVTEHGFESFYTECDSKIGFRLT